MSVCYWKAGSNAVVSSNAVFAGETTIEPAAGTPLAGTALKISDGLLSHRLVFQISVLVVQTTVGLAPRHCSLYP